MNGVAFMKDAYIKTLLHFGVQLTATDVLRVDGCLLWPVSKMPYCEVMSYVQSQEVSTASWKYTVVI